MTKASVAFCVDIDNVIAQTDEVMRRVIADYTGNRVQLAYRDVTDYDYCKCSDTGGNTISRREWDEIHGLFSEPQYLMKIEPMAGAVEALHALAERGAVHLATSRLPQAQEATLDWLKARGLSGFDLRFLPHRQKHLHFQQVTAVIEDDYEQAVLFAGQGTPSFLLEHPWNVARDRIENVYWSETWAELVPRLLVLADRP